MIGNDPEIEQLKPEDVELRKRVDQLEARATTTAADFIRRFQALEERLVLGAALEKRVERLEPLKAYTAPAEARRVEVGLVAGYTIAASARTVEMTGGGFALVLSLRDADQLSRALSRAVLAGADQ